MSNVMLKTLVAGLLGFLCQIQIAGANPLSGHAIYLNNCASCHGLKLNGAFGPPLSGAAFHQKWAGLGSEALLKFIVATMPPANPGGLTAEEYFDGTAFILAENGLSSLSKRSQAQQADVAAPEAALDAGGAGNAAQNEDAQFRAAMAHRSALLDSISPVTEAMLRTPPDDDWLNWRRTDDGLAFSPLAQVTVENAGDLRVAWSLSLPAGTNQITPLVHDGVMFVNSSGVVQALDVVDGELLWKYSRKSAPLMPAGPPLSQPRNMAIFGNTLFVPTVDNHMIALDAKSGALLWDHLIEKSHGILRLTSGPIVVHGKVIQGVSGCAGASYPGGCFIVALDAKAGNEIWRFDTIARPGHPEGNTWNSAPLSQRYGASVWIPGTYDPELNLVYFGTGQSYHIAPLIRPKPTKAGAADALYTDTTLALNPDTGELTWHFQHLARDVWDLDWAFERTLITLPTTKGATRTVVTMGKLGILDALDAKTGRFLFSYDSGLQNLVTKIDSKTGRKTTDPTAEPQANKEKFVCPFAGGARSWPATAFDPRTKTLFVPMFEWCMNYLWKPDEGWDIQYTVLPRKNSDGDFGRVAAVNLETHQPVWTVRRRASQASAIVATAGGVLFEGSRDRWFRASDSATGKVLWQTRLDLTPNASPIVFGKDGVEYLAITTGGGGPIDVSPQSLTPEITNPGGATTLWVFKLGHR
jgi:alcohol dehydrogenase (cytochrome c)